MSTRATPPLGDECAFEVGAASEVIEHSVGAGIAHDKQHVEVAFGHQWVQISTHEVNPYAWK